VYLTRLPGLPVLTRLFSVIWFRGTSVWVPRRKTAVKIKCCGAVDIHFHGAFGIDLMTASFDQLDRLSLRLTARGALGFRPPTLSVPYPELRQAIRRLGHWVSVRTRDRLPGAAFPLGIHLEGPYLSPHACGAHAPRCLRKFDLHELETLWNDSQKQL